MYLKKKKPVILAHIMALRICKILQKHIQKDMPKEKRKYIDHTVQCIACTRASFLFQMAFNNKNSSGCTSQDMPEEKMEYI